MKKELQRLIESDGREMPLAGAPAPSDNKRHHLAKKWYFRCTTPDWTTRTVITKLPTASKLHQEGEGQYQTF